MTVPNLAHALSPYLATEQTAATAQGMGAGAILGSIFRS
jgi:hypothetical protein